METAAYSASVFIGISLGLIGGGGSILTVPVLVYLFGVDAVLATSYSLFIVGTTSLAGSFSYFKKGWVNIRTAIVFGIPSIVAVFLTRAYVLPAIPQEIVSTGNFTITKPVLLMLIFGVLMISASYSMVKKNKKEDREAMQKQKFNYPLILAEGTLVGILTGLVGAGGGFLIIPALVVLGKLPMKEAVGTSLVIIAAKSLIGFWGESSDTFFDWAFLLKVTAFAFVGMLIGTAASKKISGEKLKPVFGWFILAMGFYIILKETIFN